MWIESLRDKFLDRVDSTSYTVSWDIRHTFFIPLFLLEGIFKDNIQWCWWCWDPSSSMGWWANNGFFYFLLESFLCLYFQPINSVEFLFKRAHGFFNNLRTDDNQRLDDFEDDFIVRSEYLAACIDRILECIHSFNVIMRVILANPAHFDLDFHEFL